MLISGFQRLRLGTARTAADPVFALAPELTMKWSWIALKSNVFLTVHRIWVGAARIFCHKESSEIISLIGK